VNCWCDWEVSTACCLVVFILNLIEIDPVSVVYILILACSFSVFVLQKIIQERKENMRAPIKNTIMLQFPSFANLTEKLIQSRVNDTDSLIAFINNYTHHQTNSELNYRVLHEAVKQYDKRQQQIEQRTLFTNVVPFIVSLADQTHDLFPTGKYDYLRAGVPNTIELTQLQCACILSNAFLCRFPRTSNKNEKDYQCGNLPSINYDYMFHQSNRMYDSGPKTAKLLMLFHYFQRISERMPSGNLIIERKVVNRFPDFSKWNNPLKSFHVSAFGGIGDVTNTLEVDFANEYIGGGSLSYGCVQEEIKFSVCPELNVTRLFCEKILGNEAIIMTGGEQFSRHRGYGGDTEYDGPFYDNNRDVKGNITTKTCAIDALRVYDKLSQFTADSINREIEKAYVGFYDNTIDPSIIEPVSTGNWGCGAFGGDRRLKSVIQWISASVCGRSLIYYPFDTKGTFAQELQQFVITIRKGGYTVADVYIALMKLEHILNLFNSDQQQPDIHNVDAFELIYKILGIVEN
jgi:poly(ADP-ribose) glycohydrolase